MSTIVCITPYFSTKPELIIQTIDTETFEGSFIKTDLKSESNLQNEFEKLSVKKIKVVLFCFMGINLNQEQAAAKFFFEHFKKNWIHLFCCSWNSIYLSAAFLACADEYGNEAIIDNMEFIFCSSEDYTNYNISKEKNGIFGVNTVYKNHKRDVKRILPTLTSSKFYLSPFISKPGSSAENGYKEMQKYIIENLNEPKNVITFTKENNRIYLNKAIISKCLKLLENRPFKFDVPNIGFNDYGISNGDIMNFTIMSRKEYMKKFLIKISKTENHPITKTFVNYEKFDKLLFCEGPPTVPGFTCFQKGYAPELGLAILLSVDKFFKGDMTINGLTEKGYETFVGNVIFITLNDTTFNVEIVKNGKLCNIGLNEIPFVIAFANNRIQIGNEAIKIKEKQNSFVIFDILKIISTDPKKLKPNPKWGFQLIKDEKNDKTLLEFDTFRGRRKSTPEFLLAIFIRWALKNVELKNGQMPEKIVIVKTQLNDEIKEIFKKSCKMAKLQSTIVQISEYKIIEI